MENETVCDHMGDILILFIHDGVAFRLQLFQTDVSIGGHKSPRHQAGSHQHSELLVTATIADASCDPGRAAPLRKRRRLPDEG
jgi:hypothetical protein